MHHFPRPPGYAAKDLVWIAAVVLLLLLWVVAVIHGWLELLGWE